jgi:predicted GIY-YIG superfamily endonuclease
MNTKTTLYRFFAADGRLLYVGITGSLSGRLMSHNSDKPWFTQIATATFQHHRTRTEAIKAELLAIHREGPLYNVAGNARGKARLDGVEHLKLSRLRSSLLGMTGKVRVGQTVLIGDRDELVAAIVPIADYRRYTNQES